MIRCLRLALFLISPAVQAQLGPQLPPAVDAELGRCLGTIESMPTVDLVKLDPRFSYCDECRNIALDLEADGLEAAALRAAMGCLEQSASGGAVSVDHDDDLTLSFLPRSPSRNVPANTTASSDPDLLLENLGFSGDSPRAGATSASSLGLPLGADSGGRVTPKLVLIDAAYQYVLGCPGWDPILQEMGGLQDEDTPNPRLRRLAIGGGGIFDEMLESRKLRPMAFACHEGEACDFHAHRSVDLIRRVCPNCRVIPLVYNELSLCRLADVILAAAVDFSPDLIAIPLDFSRALDDGENCGSLAVQRALSKVRSAGIAIFAAAGNKLARSSNYDVTVPATDACTIAISAVESEVIARPDSRILRTAKYVTKGPSLFAPVPVGGYSSPVPCGDLDSFSEQILGDTSAALAVAAGAFGLVKSCAPSLSPAEVESILAVTGTAVKGIDGSECAVVCGAFGGGRECLVRRRINACRSLEMAAEKDATGACRSRLEVFVGPGCT